VVADDAVADDAVHEDTQTQEWGRAIIAISAQPDRVFNTAVIWTITAPAITDATMIEVAWPRW